MTHTNRKGFTLIELLIVIGILAILATAVILILNPAQLFAQARDSQRISDLATMKSALAFYLSTVTNINLGTPGTCYVYESVPGSITDCGGRHTASGYSESASLSVDGTGWMQVNFNLVPGNSPLSVLPRDPRSKDGMFYSYVPAGTTFELNADMESARYQNTGSDDVESTDGGNKADFYEVGNAPGLIL